MEEKSMKVVSFENSDEEEEEAPELVKGVEVANGTEPKKPLHQQNHGQMSLEPPRKRQRLNEREESRIESNMDETMIERGGSVMGRKSKKLT
jgi:hypothetical protein